MVSLFNTDCRRILNILLSFLAIAVSRTCESIVTDMSPTNSSFFSAEDACCQSSSATATSTLNVSKVVEDAAKMRRNHSNSFLSRDSISRGSKLKAPISAVSEQLQWNYLERSPSSGNGRSNKKERSHSNLYLKLFIGQDSTATNIDNLREIRRTKNRPDYLDEKKAVLNLEDGIDIVASTHDNSDIYIDIRVKREPYNESEVFRKALRIRKMMGEREFGGSRGLSRENVVAFEKSIMKPSVKAARRLLEVRASEEMSPLLGSKGIHRDERAAIIRKSAEFEVLPKEMDSSVNLKTVTGTRVKRERKPVAKKREKGSTGVSGKCRAHRAVRSIEEIRELAERLVTKVSEKDAREWSPFGAQVNELQNYLTFGKQGSDRKRGRKRGRRRERNDFLAERSPTTAKLSSRSSETATSSTSKILGRSVSITSDNNIFKGMNRRQRKSELLTRSGTPEFSSRRKRKSRRRWDRWTDWSSCSVTCGKGRQIRWRYCIRDCDTAESEMEAKDCQLPACAPGKFLGIF